MWHKVILLHTQIKTCAAIKKFLVPSAFSILGRLRRQAMNSAQQNGYCLGGRPPETRLFSLITPTRREYPAGSCYLHVSNPETSYSYITDFPTSQNAEQDHFIVDMIKYIYIYIYIYIYKENKFTEYIVWIICILVLTKPTLINNHLVLLTPNFIALFLNVCIIVCLILYRNRTYNLIYNFI